MFRGLAKRCGANTETIGDILQGFRDRGFTIGRYINRCITFCILWVAATYLYMKSLKELYSTDVIVLFATNVASVYLLSWVILHEQFVGVRVSFSIFASVFQSNFSFHLDRSSNFGRYRNCTAGLYGWDQRLKNPYECCAGGSFRRWLRRLSSDV